MNTPSQSLSNKLLLLPLELEKTVDAVNFSTEWQKNPVQLRKCYTEADALMIERINPAREKLLSFIKDNTEAQNLLTLGEAKPFLSGMYTDGTVKNLFAEIPELKELERIHVINQTLDDICEQIARKAFEILTPKRTTEETIQFLNECLVMYDQNTSDPEEAKEDRVEITKTIDALSAAIPIDPPKNPIPPFTPEEHADLLSRYLSEKNQKSFVPYEGEDEGAWSAEEDCRDDKVRLALEYKIMANIGYQRDLKEQR